MNAIEFRLDYFQIYELERPISILRTTIVELRGQFDKEYAKARLISLDKFADRVSKNGEDFYDKNAHLNWYSLRQPNIPNRRRLVIVRNQFYPQEQELLIYRLVGLLVPAQKRIYPSRKFSPITELDHYKVYRVIEGQRVDRPPVKLEDQFGGREARVYEPYCFAVPVFKKYRDKEYKILNKDAHLTIYKATPSKDVPAVVDTRDQFAARRGLKLGPSYLLAVPSKKVDWKDV